ncbi:MAG: group II intron reverse transcriptase/maturase [Chlamydiales bacterium]
MHRNEEDVFTKLRRIEELAKLDVELKFTSLAHLLNLELLKHSLKELNKHGTPGVDGVTVAQFAQNTDANIETLHQELREGKYRADSVRRAYIPKAGGKLRPLGIPTVKDRIVQRAAATIIGKIYEPYFLDVSFGFRPGRSAHDALETIGQTVNKNPVNWIVDVDIKGYFDHVNHNWMIKFLEHRITDKMMLRIIAKWLKAGIMENGVVARNEEGTPQGGPISPLLANIYLHYVLDLWFEKKYKHRCQGFSFMVRYADDFIVGFQRKEEAIQFLKDLKQRFAEFGLEVAEEKTQIVAFGKNSSENGKIGPSGTPRTFKFLGFIHYMKQRGDRTKRAPVVARKPKRESRNKFLANVKESLKKCMHTSIPWQKKLLTVRLKGYYNYFGLQHCLKPLQHVKWHVERLWMMSLRRRSQKHKLWWSVVRHKPWFKLPEPRLIR